MNDRIFELRRFYFTFLYLSFVYLGLLMLVLGKNVKPVNPGMFEQLLIGLSAVIPAYILFKRKTSYIFEKKEYLKLLTAGQIPLIIGTALSAVYSNYLFFFLSYPIFLTAFFILLPTKKAVERKDG
ncbi:hypothetical protein [Persephonella sp.]